MLKFKGGGGGRELRRLIRQACYIRYNDVIMSAMASQITSVCIQCLPIRYTNLSDGVYRCSMTTSLKGTIFRVPGLLRGESTGHRWIPLTEASNAALIFSLICAWINCRANNREAGDLICHHVHYDVTVMRAPDFSTNRYYGNFFGY